mmetsp:Transcript_11917/g.18280  ORF Transcript_11917/g.18280 Transcript_11917/m.18280 type:complete len:653 (-) Transcript_11917:161-2119(-)
MNGNYDEEKKRKQMDAALDEVLMGGGGGASSETNGEQFLASSTWKGPKAGYYFGTSSKGTGYYWDVQQKNGEGENTHKTKRKRITIDEGKNEIKSIPARMTGQELLEQVEQKNQKQVELSDRGIRAAHAQLRKWVEKNALERAEHSENPEEYMESELALHQQLESYGGFATQPAVLLKIPVEEFQMPWLEVLAHPNIDIVTTACRVIAEWMDEDEDVESTEIRWEIGKRLVQTTATSPIVELMVSNLGRLQTNWQEDEENQQGIEDILTLLENLLELDVQQQLDGKQLLESSSFAIWLVKKTTVLSWLVQQLPFQHGPSVQVLALLLQQADIYEEVKDWTQLPPYSSLLTEDNDEEETKDKKKKAEKPNIDCMELLLQAMAVFRKTQPTTTYELEFLENVVLCLASLLTYSSHRKTQEQFLEAQGMELVIRCLREKVHAGGIGLGLLETSHRPACEHFISHLHGLKHIFPIFMQRSFPKPALLSSDKTKQKKKKAHWMQKLEQHTIRILYHLAQHITADSPDDCLQRLVCKFLENDCEKLDRLIQLLLKYDHKARRAEYNYYRFQESEDETENMYNALAAKLEGGGTHFQYCAVICAFCAFHSKAAHTHLLETLQLHQSGISLVKMGLEEILKQADKGCPQGRMWQDYLQQL